VGSHCHDVTGIQNTQLGELGFFSIPKISLGVFAVEMPSGQLAGEIHGKYKKLKGPKKHLWESIFEFMFQHLEPPFWAVLEGGRNNPRELKTYDDHWLFTTY